MAKVPVLLLSHIYLKTYSFFNGVPSFRFENFFFIVLCDMRITVVRRLQHSHAVSLMPLFQHASEFFNFSLKFHKLMPRISICK